MSVLMDSLVVCLKEAWNVAPIITGLPLEALLRVIGNLFVPEVAKRLAAGRVRDETASAGLLIRYLTIEQYRSGERLQLD
ncbi:MULTISPECIES: hypothetical protein [Pseudomonas]|uniref:hypothetical protein n=1 Tax=Pseudomonas TaxID=286 RepID=UPI001AE55BE4|nr:MULTISPECIES: hypothetical protein [unclassified Pseudomonas]MBP1126782.1 hypothetical protein [Pseudomonas sp. PvP025]MDQ0400642.1 hypothetical protein [Pseudomonas sp. PvP006]MEB0106808.1 hypothetical protein [Pseudomonas sp. MH9.3]WPX77631.1 hypothetical protein RHM60_15355 [Pseudomonas sp. MH9.3]